VKWKDVTLIFASVESVQQVLPKHKPLKLSKKITRVLVQNLSTVPGPILNKCWTGNGAIWLADISYWPSDLTYRSSSYNILS